MTAMTGRTVLITGAGSGIGRALAVVASARGYHPVLAGRRLEALEETRTMCDAGTCVAADVATPEGRAALREAVDGRLDILVNNAGTLSVGTIASMDDAALGRMVQTNLLAPMALTRELLPALKAARGRVVNVGSVFGDIAYPYFAAYSATKFGLRGFSDALRRELSGEGVGVTYVAPRATRTGAADEFGALVEPMKMALDTPEAVATHIWRAVEAGRREAFPRGKERFFVLVQRLLPRLVDSSVGAQARDPKVRAALGPSGQQAS